MKTRNIGIAAVLMALLSLFSCVKKKDFDFDRLSSDIEISPTLIFPLLNTKMSVEDFVTVSDVNEAQTVVSYLDDGLAVFNYFDTMTSYIPYPGNPDEDIVTLPIEGEIAISIFEQNASYKDIKLLLKEVAFELFTTTNASIKESEVKNIVITIFDDKSNSVVVKLDDFLFNIEKNKRCQVNIWNITEEFYQIVPHRLHYSFDFVYDKRMISGIESDEIVNKMEGLLDFSLYGYVGGLKLVDTISLQQTMSDLPDIEELNMYLTFKNNFPFSLDVQIYFLDENYTLKDSLFLSEELISSAPVTHECASGISEKEVEVNYGAERAKNLQTARYISLSANLETYKIEEENLVKIFKDNFFGIGMTVKVKESVNLNEFL